MSMLPGVAVLHTLQGAVPNGMVQECGKQPPTNPKAGPRRCGACLWDTGDSQPKMCPLRQFCWLKWPQAVTCKTCRHVAAEVPLLIGVMQPAAKQPSALA